jgi:hypothetical protein
MAVPHKEILDRMGLTGDQVRDFQAKFSSLAQSLDPAQLAVLKNSQPSVEAAAATLGPDVTSEDFMGFIRAHAPEDASVLFFFNGMPEARD